MQSASNGDDVQYCYHCAYAWTDKTLGDVVYCPRCDDETKLVDRKEAYRADTIE